MLWCEYTGSSLEVKIEADSSDAMEIKTEADSNDITDCSRYDMISIGMLDCSNAILCAFICLRVT